MHSLTHIKPETTEIVALVRTRSAGLWAGVGMGVIEGQSGPDCRSNGSMSRPPFSNRDVSNRDVSNRDKKRFAKQPSRHAHCSTSKTTVREDMGGKLRRRIEGIGH